MCEAGRTNSSIVEVSPPSPTGKSNRPGLKWWSFAGVVLIALGLWLPRLRGPIDLRWDAGVYYILGTSLVTGHGYRILSEPGSPQAVQYPPLLPAFVALYQRACGTSDPARVGQWLRLSYASLFVAYAIATLILARRFLQPLFAFLATSFCLLHVWTIFLSDILFTELPFALLSVIFVLIAIEDGKQSRPRLRATLLFLVAATGFLLRTAGIILLLAWVVDSLIENRWRLALLRCVIALLPVLLWQGYVTSVRSSSNYLRPAYEYQRAAYQNYNVVYSDNLRLKDPFRPELGKASKQALAMRVASNVTLVPIHLGEAISIPRQFWQTGRFGHFALLVRTGCEFLIIGLGLLAILGCFLFTGRARVIPVIILLSVALICLTPWPEEFNRYLTPVAPFIALASVLAFQWLSGLRLVSAWAARAPVLRWGSVSVLIFLLLLQANTAAKFVRGDTSRSAAGKGPVVSGAHFFHGADWVDWERATKWIGEHAAPEDIVTTTAPHQLYLRTGLKAVYPPFEPNPATALDQIERVPVKFVLVDDFKYRDFSRRYALPAMRLDPLRWPLIYSEHQTAVYSRIPGARR